MNRLTSVTTPEGWVTTFGYDPAGNATSTRNALGKVLTVEFDPVGRPVVQVAPDGGRTVTKYDAVGRIVEVTDPNGATQRFGYDAVGHATSYTDGEGNLSLTSYDAVGNVLSSTNALGAGGTASYDAVNRPVEVTDAEGATTTTVFDLAGRVVSTTDPTGVVTVFAYDARGLLTATTENAVEGATPSASVNVTTSTTYDARGLAMSVTDPRGNATVYTRDALGRLTAETNAVGATTSSVLDALGRATLTTAGDGSVSTTSYTPDGYVAQVVYPDQVVDYTYDPVGNRLTMDDDLGESSWGYDWAGRVVSETDARGNTTTHTFDLAGNLAGVAYADGRTVARTFDGRGLAVSQTDTTASGTSSVTTFAYDETGAMTGQVRPSGVVTQIDRDRVGRVTSIDYTGVGVAGNPLPSGEVNPSSAAPGNAYGHCKDNGNGHPNQQPAGCSTDTLGFAFEYDARGLVAQRDVASDAATTETDYTHDELGRLTRSVAGSVATDYAWDAASNLVGESGTDDPSTSKSGDDYAIARAVNAANELVTLVKDPVGTPGGKVETTGFTYDGRGNRTGSVTTTKTGNKTHTVGSSSYVYDGMDQLTSTSGPGGSASLVRDGAGRALEVTEDGVTSARLYDGIQVIAEGSTQLTLAPNGQTLSETTTTTTTKGKNTTTSVASVDVLTDVLGSTVATASEGVISADLALFGDFGDALTTPKVDTVTGFTGKIDTAGLVEFAARTFDPATRQWVQDDRYRGTVTRAASMNRYAYVEGAPETFVDELGFYRARAAIRAQALAAWEAANAAALAAYEKAVQIAYKEAVSYEQTCGKYGCVKADMEVRGHYGFVNTADAVYGQYGYISAQSIAAQKRLELQERLVREARAKSGGGAGGGQCMDQACVQAHLKSLGMDDGYSRSASYVAPPPLEDGFVKYDGTVCAVGSACYDNYVKYPHNPAKDQALLDFIKGTGKGVWNLAWEIGSLPANAGYTAWKCTGGWTACHTRMGEQFDPIATMWDDYYEVASSGYRTVTGQQSIGEHNTIAYDMFRKYTYGGIVDNWEAGNYYESGEGTGQLGGSVALIFTPVKYLPKLPKLPASITDLGVTAEAATAAERLAANRTAGNAARDAIASRYPGSLVEQTLHTALGDRRIDILVDSARAIESKVGRTSATERVLSEIAKDKWLLKNDPKITGIEWQFSRSEVTGEIGPTAAVAAALEEAGIEWTLLP